MRLALSTYSSCIDHRWRTDCETRSRWCGRQPRRSFWQSSAQPAPRTATHCSFRKVRHLCSFLHFVGVVCMSEVPGLLLYTHLHLSSAGATTAVVTRVEGKREQGKGGVHLACTALLCVRCRRGVACVDSGPPDAGGRPRRGVRAHAAEWGLQGRHVPRQAVGRGSGAPLGRHLPGALGLPIPVFL